MQNQNPIRPKPHPRLAAAMSAILVSATASFAEIKVVVEHNDNDHATASFKFQTIRAPSKSDAPTKAKFIIVDGERDENSGDLDKLHDGKVPAEADEPAENFFFNAGTDGGRLLVDLGGAIEIKQVNSYSWHPSTRGPQVYTLYASDGSAENFNQQPKKKTQPERCGWKLLARVDTRPGQGGGGQYGVSISDSDRVIGKYRFLLFDISRTEAEDDFGNTFYSEIDVLDRNAPAALEGVAAPAAVAAEKTFPAEGGKYQITVDSSAAPELSDWADAQLAPVAQEWYPKIVKLLPSEGFEAPTNVSIVFRDGLGSTPAVTGGSRISCNPGWFKRNLQGEAIGSVVHEMVHLVQQYGRARRANPDAARPPGWLTEGIADYIRWFEYEPQAHGADLIWMRARRNLILRYNASYRISANFLNWASEKYAKDLVQKVNALLREGKYTADEWKQITGHTLQELGDEWKQELQGKLALQAAETLPNTLSAAERAAGWNLLFNGADFAGWHNFKQEGVRPGWQVKDGALVCADPHNAGDIVTTNQYDWFELQLEYNISVAGNSGIMYHVTDEGGAAWATGPEFQLEDNQQAADPIRCGWLYALYQPPTDPKTGKPLDATKPVGEWNHVRLLVSPTKCEHEINGVKYFDYVLGSEDFNHRVGRSKFAKMPHFAKSTTGYIALQGDHGEVSFRNIKLRVLTPE